MLFKILDANGRSCNGGTLQWSLPTQNADGSWTPGDWLPAVAGELALCQNGYHLAEDAQVLKWLGPRLFEAEYRGERLDANDKVVVREARLVREFAAWNECTARLFVVWCARQALALVDNPDPRSVAACDVAERYANSKATKDELAAARAAARAAAWDAAWDSARAAARAAAWDSAWAAARAAARDAAWGAARAAAWDSARDSAWAAAWAAARAAARDSAWAAARAAQYRQLMVMLGEEV
jgi:hypothetical protein